MDNVKVNLVIGHRDRWGDSSKARGYLFAEIVLSGALFGKTEVSGEVAWRYDWVEGEWKAHCEKQTLVTLENTKVPAAKRREVLQAVRNELPPLTDELIVKMEREESQRLQQLAQDEFNQKYAKLMEKFESELLDAKNFELTSYFDS